MFTFPSEGWEQVDFAGSRAHHAGWEGGKGLEEWHRGCGHHSQLGMRFRVDLVDLLGLQSPRLTASSHILASLVECSFGSFCSTTDVCTL